MKKSKPPAYPTPTRDDIAKNEFVVHVGSSFDDEGRCQFTAFWRDERKPAEGGPPDGVRGQVFHTNLVDWIRRHKAEGRVITFANPKALPTSAHDRMEAVRLASTLGYLVEPWQVTLDRLLRFKREFGGTAQECESCGRLTTMRETINLNALDEVWKFRCGEHSQAPSKVRGGGHEG